MFSAYSAGTGPLNRLKILLIDDTAPMRAIVATIFRALGASDLYEARTGAEAIELMRQIEPDIIVADYLMDRGDGVEFTRWVRANTRFAFTPIIMITAHSHRSKAEAARDAGVTEFLVKPLTAKALIQRVNSVIRTPRPFVRCQRYFGPDRRRRASNAYEGPLRRSDDHNALAI